MYLICSFLRPHRPFSSGQAHLLAWLDRFLHAADLRLTPTAQSHVLHHTWHVPMTPAERAPPHLTPGVLSTLFLTFVLYMLFVPCPWPAFIVLSGLTPVFPPGRPCLVSKFGHLGPPHPLSVPLVPGPPVCTSDLSLRCLLCVQ